MSVPEPYTGGSNVAANSTPYDWLEADIFMTKTKVQHFELLDCNACPLRERAMQVVPGRGHSNATYMIVAQAPGREENVVGLPMVGPSGKKLDSLLQRANISLNNVYYTNIAKCFPGLNAAKKDNKPGKRATEKCKTWLDQEIEMVDPEIIIVLGAVALNYFLPGEKVSEAHGQVLEWEGRTLIPMYHPAAGMGYANPELMPVIEKDWDNLPIKLKGEGHKDIPYTHLRLGDHALHDLLDHLGRFTEGEIVAFDFETTGLRSWMDRIVGVSLSLEDQNVYISCKPDGIEDEILMDDLRPLWENPTLIAHNAKFELGILHRYGIYPKHKINCTYQMAHILGETQLGLKGLTLQIFGYKMTPITDLIGTGVNEISMADVPAEVAAPYAAADSHFTLKLWHHFSEKMSEWAWDIYENIEQKMPEPVVAMEHEGFNLNAIALQDAQSGLATLSNEHESKVRDIIGNPEFNLGSAPQVLSYFRTVLGANAREVPDTNATTLQRVSADYPFGLKIIEGRHLRKLAGTYIAGLQAILPRAYSSYNPLGTQTGRFSSSGYPVLGHKIDGKKRRWGLNFQTLPAPKMWEDGDNAESLLVKRAIIADAPSSGCCGLGHQHHHVLAEADYSQIELRVQADEAGDEAMIQAYLDDYDLHLLTQEACELANFMPRADAEAIRRVAKVINFALQYEPDDNSAAFVLKRTCAEAQVFLSDAQCFRLVRSKREAYPGVVKYYDRIRDQLRIDGYVENQMGRRLYLPWLDGISKAVKRANNSNHRKGVNMPIQGTAADILKLALIALHETKSEYVVIKNLVHDSIVFQCPEEKVSDLWRWAQPIMEGIWALAVPVKVDIKVGPNLADMEKIIA
jgi:DNA polymerase-1